MDNGVMVSRYDVLTKEKLDQIGKVIPLKEALDARWDYVVFPWGADGASCAYIGNGMYEGLKNYFKDIPLDLKVRITHYEWEDNGQGYDAPVAYAEVV